MKTKMNLRRPGLSAMAASLLLVLLFMLLPAAGLAQAPPAAPSALLATAVTGPSLTNPQVTLAWADNSLDETGFRIQRSIDSFATVDATFATAANTVAFNDVTVTAGATFRYRVNAVNAAGNSAFSNVALVTLPGTALPIVDPSVGAPQVSLSLPAPPTPQIHSGAPNIVRAAITSAGSTIQTAQWQARMAAGGSLSALEVFAQVVPNLTPRTQSGTTNDTTPAPSGLPPSATVLFAIEGVVTAADPAKGEWRIGAQPVVVYESEATGIVNAPVVGDLVRIVGNRTQAPGPIVAEVITMRARAPQPAGDAAVEMAFLFNGTVSTAGATLWTVQPPAPNPAVNFNILPAEDPLATAIDPGIGLGSVVTIEFTAAGGGTAAAPVMKAMEVFAQVPADIPAPRHPNPIIDSTPVSLQAPPGSTALMVIMGQITAINVAGGEWRIGAQPVVVYESSSTLVRDFFGPPQVGQGVRIVANRTVAPGPIVAEVIRFSAVQQPGPAVIETAFLLNGTATAVSPAAWTVQPPTPLGGQPPAPVTFQVMSAVDPSGLGPSAIDPGMGLAPLNPVVTVEFFIEGGAPPPDPTLWGAMTFSPAVNQFQTTLALPAVAADTGAFLYFRATDALGRTTATVFPATLLAVAAAAPAAPASLVASAAGTQVNLTWTDASNNESVFRVERSADSFATAPATFLVPANATSFSDTGVAPGNLSYRVVAVNGAGSSAPSNVAAAAVGLAAAPTGLVAVADGPSQVTLTWTDNSADETGFTIERSTDGLTFATIGAVGANTTTFTDAAVPAGAIPTYRVTATNAVGNSPPSASAQVSMAAPGAPSSLQATASPAGPVTLTWVDNSNNEAGFRVERSANAGATFTVLATVNPDVAIYADNAAAPATAYQYRVTAFNGIGNTASNVVSVTSAAPTAAPNAPTALAATAATSSLVNLAWTDNSTNEAGFRVLRSTDGIAFTQVGPDLAVNATAFADTTASPSVTFTYRVVAFNSVAASAPTNTAQATPPIPLAGSGGGGGGGGSVAPAPAAISMSGLTGDADLRVDSSGKAQNAVKLSSSGPGQPTLQVQAGTVMKTAAGAPLSSITLSAPASVPPAPAENAIVLAQDFGPDGATFDPPMTLTLTFDPAALPAGVAESSLVIAFWDGSKWVNMESTVNAEANTISARIAHFTIFGILAAQPPPPAPAPEPAPAPAPSSPPPPAPPAPEVTAPAPTAPEPAAPAQTNWGLIAGIVAAIMAAAGLVIYIERRRPARK